MVMIYVNDIIFLLLLYLLPAEAWSAFFCDSSTCSGGNRKGNRSIVDVEFVAVATLWFLCSRMGVSRSVGLDSYKHFFWCTIGFSL